MKLIDMQITNYMELLASNAPAPGGGSASALTGAQGIGLVAMAAALTLGKKKYENDWAHCEQVGAKAVALQQALIAQIDADTEAFNLVSAAFKLPKETDEEKAQRGVKIAEATLVATEVPFKTMELALTGMEAARSLLGRFNANCASDLGVGALSLNACLKGAWLNVSINLSGLSDEEVKQGFVTKAGEMLLSAGRLEKEILDGIGLDP